MTTQRMYTTPTCPVCRKASRVLLDEAKVDRWIAGELVQDVWPEVSGDVRELMISGTHPACFAGLYPEEEPALPDHAGNGR